MNGPRPAQAAAGGAGPPTIQAGSAPAVRDRDQPSVIVMPFDNLSSEADDYFVDGVVEEITSALSRVREFFVIARQSAFTYKGRFADVREIGQELGVSYVVEGTVRRGGDRLRISVQLVDAATRTQLWSDRYEGVTTDIFAFQDRIAAQVAGAIHPAVRNAEIAVARLKPPGSLRAYDLVLQAYPKLWRQAPRGKPQAIALLRQRRRGGAAIRPRPCAAGLVPFAERGLHVVVGCRTGSAMRAQRRGRHVGRDRRRSDRPDGRRQPHTASASMTWTSPPRTSRMRWRSIPTTPGPGTLCAGWRSTRKTPIGAKKRFERSLMLSPLDPLEFNLKVGLAMVMSWKGEYAQSAKLLREVLHKHPRLTWAYRQLAFASALAGDVPAARDAIKASPSASSSARSWASRWGAAAGGRRSSATG